MFEYLTSLLKQEYQGLWLDYCAYIQLGWKHFFYECKSPTVNRDKLRLLDKAIRKDIPLPDNLLRRLQQKFVTNNISIYLLLEPLQAWRYISDMHASFSEQQISEIINYSVAPAARLLMVLNDQPPSTYMPMTSYLHALYLLKLINEKSCELKEIKRSKKKQYKKIQGLLNEAHILLSVVNRKKLKWKLAFKFNELQVQINHIINNKQTNFSLLDRVKIFLYSCMQFILIRHRSVTTRGL